jgi:uncharacterized protein (DUF1501 family)
MRRRSFLAGLGAGAGALWGPRIGWASAPTERRLVVAVLRGGLDGLGAVPVPGDPRHAEARGDAAVEDALPLDGTFALHPGLAPLKARWDAGELLVVHATAGPYRDRSHFDGQNVLENGTAAPYGAASGWLNRALVEVGGVPALAVGRTVPLLLSGPARASSGDPARGPEVDEAVLARAEALYRDDPVFGPALAEGLAMERLLAAHRVVGLRRGAPLPGRQDDAVVLGRTLAAPTGPRVAVVEVSGWDTHTRQEGTLAERLPALATTLEGLREGLGEAWGVTVVAVVTEFGRTVRANGSGGTDHGVGGAALLLGGAVAGGRVVADWPGLGAADLLDGRDLRPTIDLRAVLAGVVRDHLGVGEAGLARVFPGGPAAMDGLVCAG